MASEELLPRLREDIEIVRHSDDDGTEFFLRDPVQQKSFLIDRSVVEILDCWSQSATVNDLIKRCREHDPNVTDRTISEVINYMIGFDLIDARGQSLDQIIDKRRRALNSNLKLPILKIHLFDPQIIVGAIDRYLGFLTHKRFLWITLFLLGIASILAIPAQSKLENLFNLSFSNFVAVVLALFICKFFHEMGHAISASRFGAVVSSVGLMWYGFLPIPYTDLADIWSVRGKKRKMIVAMSGMISELYVAAYAFIFWVFLPVGLLADVCAYAFTINLIQTFFFNANPLGRADGYYILSDYLGARNLKIESAIEVLNFFMSGLNFRMKQYQWNPKKLGLLLYSLLCIFYRIFIITSLAWLLNMVGLWGGLALLFYLGLVFFVLVLPTFLEFKLAWMDLRRNSPEIKNSWRRLSLPAVIFIFIVLLLPMPSGVSGPAVLGANSESTIYTSLSGELATSLPVAPSVYEPGKLIASLIDTEMDLLIKDAQQYARSILLSRDIQSGVQNFSKSLEFSELSTKASARVESAFIRRQQLDIYSPENGRLVPYFETVGRKRLSASMPIGKFIGQDAAVTLYLKPSDLRRIAIGSRFTFVDSGGHFKTTGTISSVSDAPVSRVPYPELYNSWGGPLAVISMETGELAPLNLYYELRGKLDDNPMTGEQMRMAGQAVVFGDNSSLFQIFIDSVSTIIRKIYVVI